MYLLHIRLKDYFKKDLTNETKYDIIMDAKYEISKN